MLKKRKTNTKDYVKSSLKAIPILLVSIFTILFYNSNISFSQILFHTTMPYSDIDMRQLFNFDEGIEIFMSVSNQVSEDVSITNVNHSYDLEISENIEENITSTFDPDRIEYGIMFNRELGLLGVNDIQSIYYNPDYGFSPSVHVPFEMNISYADIAVLRDVNVLLNRFYSMDSNTGIIDNRLNIDNFLNADLSIQKDPSVPQVLILHTHAASEFFIDSPNMDNLFYGIVGAGVEFVRILEEKYGLNVIHYQGVHDRVNGRINRSGAYERIEPSIVRILEENPTIELVMDLHRDGVAEGSNPNFTTYIDGRPTARIMFVNGVSAINEGGRVRRLYNLPNPYIDQNLALSFNMQMAAQEMFPNLMRRLYLKAFRYMNHLRPNSMLVEIGSQYTTMEEAWNAMEPLADLVYAVMFAN